MVLSLWGSLRSGESPVPMDSVVQRHLREAGMVWVGQGLHEVSDCKPGQLPGYHVWDHLVAPTPGHLNVAVERDGSVMVWACSQQTHMFGLLPSSIWGCCESLWDLGDLWSSWLSGQTLVVFPSGYGQSCLYPDSIQ